MRKPVNRSAAALALLAALLATVSACTPRDASKGEAVEPRGAGAEAPLREPAADVQLDPPRLIVLVSIDTLRADHLGAYGYERFTSPVLDGMAAEGALFEDASAAAPWTLPSHASMLTGLYPHEHGVTTMRLGLGKDVPTLASLLARAGYRTAAVVNSTWLERDTFGLTRDFERYAYVPESAEQRAPTRWVTDQAIEWMSTLGDGRLLLFLHYYDVHADYASEPSYEKLFVRPYQGPADGSSWQLTRANLEDQYLDMCHRHFDPIKCTFGSAGRPFRIDASVTRVHFDAKDVSHLIDLYDAGIRQMDTELGRLFAWMRGRGLLDQALVVVTADHGEEFMEHGRVEHFLPTWQALLHVPLILHGPGVPRGVRVKAPVSLVDIVPTLLDFAGVQANTPLDGVDLRPLLHGQPLADRDLYGEASGGLTYQLMMPGIFPVYRSVRHGNDKLIYDSKSDRYSLYELSSDPGERHDLAKERPEVAAKLRAEMQRRYDGGESAAGAANAVELPDEEIERLRSLGYLQ